MSDPAPRPIDSMDDFPNLYGYVPTTWICILFFVLFSITSLIHLAQSIRYRIWWLIPTAVACGLSEVIGWGGRTWSSYAPNRLDPFLMQITTTIIAPSFLTAAIFTMLGIIIKLLGTQYSWLSPRWYLIIFITIDVAALVIQSIGGARASMAARQNEDAEPGGQIMMYGIIVQIIGISIYVICQTEFLIRYYFNKPVRRPLFMQRKNSEATQSEATLNAQEQRANMDKGTFQLLIAMCFVTIWVYIRSIYRTIELEEGWQGRIITTQLYFNVLDGMPIVIAMFTFNFFHPGRLLPNYRRDATNTTSQYDVEKQRAERSNSNISQN